MIYYFAYGSNLHHLQMKRRCPKCKKNADLGQDFSNVECSHCGLNISYGEYVRIIAHEDPAYSDILGDYTGATEGQTAGTLDDWDSQSK